MEEAGVDKHWKIAGKIPVKGLSCCPIRKRETAVTTITNDNFLTSLDELISILFSLFSENGDITRRDETFWASVELVKKVLSRARLQDGKIYFSFPKKARIRMPTLPKFCSVKLTPGNPTRLYKEWIGNK